MANHQSHMLWNDFQLVKEEEDPFAIFPSLDYFNSIDDFSSSSSSSSFYSTFENWDLDLLNQPLLLDPYPLEILQPSFLPDYSLSSFGLELEPINSFFGFEDYLYDQLDLFHDDANNVLMNNNVVTFHANNVLQNQMLSNISNQTLAISDEYRPVGRQRMARAAKRPRSSVEDYDGRNKAVTLTREAISEYFYMPITQAAKEMNIGLTLLKKRCREVGICRWPHRKLMSLQTLINNVQEMGDGDVEKSKVVVEMLKREMKLLEEVPDRELGENTKKLRQACFKANYKKRKLIGPTAVDDANESMLI